MSMLRAMQRTSLNVHLTVAQRSVCVVALSLLTACATRLDNAPVVDRSGDLGTQSAQAAGCARAARVRRLRVITG